MNETDAIALAQNLYRGVVRKYSGEPYFNHALRVARCSPPEMFTVAILHDVLEDNLATVDDLLKEGVLDWEIDAIKIITRNTDETYANYIKRVSLSSPEVVSVKLADLADNTIDLPKASLRRRYKKARRYLSGVSKVGSLLHKRALRVGGREILHIRMER